MLPAVARQPRALRATHAHRAPPTRIARHPRASRATHAHRAPPTRFAGLRMRATLRTGRAACHLASLHSSLQRPMMTLLFSMLLSLGAPLVAQQPATFTVTDTIRYDVAFPNASHHEAEISVTYTGLPPGPLELRMSRSSPGRYALHEFAKNVYSVRAVDGSGRTLTGTRPNPHQWDVHGHDGTIRVTYTLFADRADGTYTGIDLTHAHMNMPATFMWARGTADRPIGIRFRVPPGADWRVATQLRATAEAGYYVAPHLQYFLDSPTELSDHALREWLETAEGATQTIRIAMHHQGTDAELDKYTAHTQRIVREQAAVFGELPTFDYGTYTFIACYLPWVAGDGMEHRNSTILTSTGSLRNMTGLLGTVAHEFFHAWNVERLRPQTLEPFDFEQANMSDALWFAEGFTSYYGPLTMRRADVTTNASYAASLSGMLNTVINGPGRRFHSPVEMSMQAPFVDAATAVDPHNRANTFISYYTWGAAIGLGLDLTLRSRFGITLDDYMRELWKKYGMHQADFTPTRPYSVDDLRVTLGDVTADTAFANEFFRRYIEGRDVVDYATLLQQAGLLLRRASPGTASIGMSRVDVEDGSLMLAAPVLVGTPLHDAGAFTGDRLVALDGTAVSSADDVQRVLASKRPGDDIEITFEQRGVRRTSRVTAIEDPALQVVLFEDAGMELPDAARAFRVAWLGSRAN
jgi:predicted metalloprotease with PDZ domain